MAPKSEKSDQSCMYAIFYPEHEGYSLVDRLGGDGSTTLLRGVKDDRLYVRRKPEAELQESEHDHELGEIKNCRDVAGVLKRVHYQTYKHCEEAEASTEKDGSLSDRFKSIATIWPYCNGGELGTVMHYNSYEKEPEYNQHVKEFKSDEELEVFVWHVFSRLLLAYDSLYDEGVAHLNGHNHNIFLNFDGTAKFPEVYLSDWSLTKKLDKDGIEFGMALLYMNIIHLMNKASYNVENDLENIDCRYPDPATNGRPSPALSPKLVSCVQELGKMGRAALEHYYPDIPHSMKAPAKRLGLKGLRDGVHNLRLTVTKHAKEAKKKLGLPNMSWLHEYKTLPDAKIYKSRAELMADNTRLRYRTAGPWRIARVDHSGAISAGEKTAFNLLDPADDGCAGDTEYPTGSKKAGTPCNGDHTKLLRLAMEQDQASDDKIIHSIFEVDPHWSQAKLYGGKSTGKKGKTLTPKKPAGVSKRGPQKQKETKPQVKGTRQSRRIRSECPEEKYMEGL